MSTLKLLSFVEVMSHVNDSHAEGFSPCERTGGDMCRFELQDRQRQKEDNWKDIRHNCGGPLEKVPSFWKTQPHHFM